MPDNVTSSAARPLIEIKHVSKRFGPKTILDDISLTIEQGDAFGILGLSGAGKSTLLRAVNGLETIDDGEIYFNGELLASPKHPVERMKRQQIAVIFQSFNLLNQATALQNVELALPLSYQNTLYGLKKEKNKKIAALNEQIKNAKKDCKFKQNKQAKSVEQNPSPKEEFKTKIGEINLEKKRINDAYKIEIQKASSLYHKTAKEKALEALRQVGLEAKANSYPSQLSGGEKQRVAIARALALNPKVLLSDEATSALDAENAEAIINLLADLNKRLGLTVIMVSHQIEVIEKFCSKVAIIDKSKIVEQGNLRDVFLSPRSEIAKTLIYSGKSKYRSDVDAIRLLFKGNTDTPIVASIVKDLDLLLSIIYADTKVIEGKVYGQLLLEAPKTKSDRMRLLAYLAKKGIAAEEVSHD